MDFIRRLDNEYDEFSVGWNIIKMKNIELAKYWIELQNLPRDTHEADELMWAAFEVMNLSDHNPQKCFDFILEVLSQTDNEWVLTNLAAGPLEDLLSQHPNEGILLVEKEISRNTKLKHILQGVWQNMMPEETWQRLQKLRD